MRKIALLSLAFAISGCSSTGVILLDKETYMIGKRSAQTGFGPPIGAKADVYKEANGFCAKENKAVTTVDLKMVDSGFARPGSVELVFRCN